MLNPERPLNDERFTDRLARFEPLRDVASLWQPVVQRALGGLSPRVRDALHGTPLGHPLHATLTDVPVGAWTASSVLDVLTLCGMRRLEAGADAALAVGLAGAAASALTGWADWSDTKDEVRTLGMGHALLAGAAIATFGTALVLRLCGARTPGVALALGAYCILSVGAYAGGEIAQGMQLGAKHTAEPLEPPAEFVTVASLAELRAEGSLRVNVAGAPVLLSRSGADVYAVAAVCTHRGAPLGDRIEDGCAVCPWHGSRFDVRDGAVIGGPATFPLPRYDARVVDDAVQVRGFRLSRR
jgi:nitrite reductase/ring-hydroxylating ferredoxin subunit